MKKFLFIILLFFTIGISAQPEIPTLSKYANDFTGTLSSSQVSQLDQYLKKFDDQTSNQVVLLVINDLDGYPIEMYANETAEKNKIGSKENDNGVLFVVSLNDRKMRIEVGYGLEGALPDALSSSILRNEVKPYFKRDRYDEGIQAGLVAIMQASVGEYTRDKKREKEDDEGGRGISGYFIFVLLFLLLKLFGRGGRGGGIGSAILLGGMLGGMGGGRSSGGGFGGGGFSGGGGGFGGGGASGSW